MSYWLRNSIITGTTFLISFCIFSEMTLLVSVLFSSGNERYIPLFSKRYTQEILYNETIEAIRHDDFSLAHAHIQKLIQQPITSHIADIEELHGDILVRDNGSTGDILRLYE